MLTSPRMLIPTAKAAGMSTPPNPNDYFKGKDRGFHGWRAENFPHFHTLCIVQLHRAMEWTEPRENAKILMKFSVKELKTMTIDDLLEKGIKVKGGTFWFQKRNLERLEKELAHEIHIYVGIGAAAIMLGIIAVLFSL